MKHSLSLAILCASLAVPLAACGSDSDSDSDSDTTAAAHAGLPDVVPADFPFPADVSLDVRTQQLASGKQTVVSFSFSGDADKLYAQMRQYAVDNGYDIPIETKSSGRFTARKDIAHNFVVSIQDMGSVKVATVSFLAPRQ